MQVAFTVQKLGSEDTGSSVYLDDAGIWTPESSQARQFSSWESANKISSKFNCAYVIQSATTTNAKDKETNVNNIQPVIQTPANTKSIGPTKSDQIREMLTSGMSRGQIAKALNIKYQLVRAVDIRMQKSSEPVEVDASEASEDVQEAA